MASQKHAAPPHIRPDRTWGVLGRFSPWTSDEGREQQSVVQRLGVSIRKSGHVGLPRLRKAAVSENR